MTIAALPARTAVTLGLRDPDVAHAGDVAPSVSRRNPFGVDDDRRPHRRHEALRVDLAIRGPVGLDHERRGAFRRLERCRAQGEDPGEFVRHDAHGRVVSLHDGPGAGELRQSSTELDRRSVSVPCL